MAHRRFNLRRPHHGRGMAFEAVLVCGVENDQTINPDLERFLPKRMNATTVELDAGHLSLVSHPKEVADLILAAAGRRE